MLWQGEKSPFFSLERGVKQRDPISGEFFNLYMDNLTETTDHGRPLGVMLGGGIVNLSKFADDVVFISPSPEHLQESLRRFSKFCDCIKLSINVKKCFTMVVRGKMRDSPKITVTVGSEELQQISEF